MSHYPAVDLIYDATSDKKKKSSKKLLLSLYLEVLLSPGVNTGEQ